MDGSTHGIELTIRTADDAGDDAELQKALEAAPATPKTPKTPAAAGGSAQYPPDTGLKNFKYLSYGKVRCAAALTWCASRVSA